LTLTHEWTRYIPEHCDIYSVISSGEHLLLNLYCRDYVVEAKLNIVTGKLEFGERKKPVLRGRVEFRKDLFLVTCFYGKDRVLWNKVEHGIGAKIACRMDICVVSSMSKERVLAVKVIDNRGEVLDQLTVPNVYDYHVASSENIIAVSTIGFSEENTVTLLVDAATASIVDYRSGFGGYAVADLDHVYVYSYRAGNAVTKVFDNNGDEVLESDGIPVLPPYNPFAYRANKLFDHGPSHIVIMDKSTLKIYDPSEYTLITTMLKPPLIRGVMRVDVEKPSVVAFTSFMGRLYLAEFAFNGEIEWVSHVLPQLSYGIASNKLVALYVERETGETRVYRISDGMLVHEDTFAPNVYPLAVRGNQVVLTNNQLISAYTLE